MIAARGTGVLAVAGLFILSLFTAAGATTTRADDKVTIVLPTKAPARSATQPARATKPLRVLFVGNSYTFYNGGLGTLVQQLAAASRNARPLEFVEVTRGDQTLEGHWKDGKALAAIKRGGWDVVVLQEHSLGPIDARERMWKYARMFDAEIRKTGARTIFYQTWARKNRPEMQAALCAAYEGIAKELKAAIAPAGVAWQNALKNNPKLSLHVPDLSHPSPAGSYLNACVFYQVLFNQSPEGLPRTIKNAAGKVLIELSEAEARLLQQTAVQTCGRSLAPSQPLASVPEKTN
jgi:hypothetical protein